MPRILMVASEAAPFAKTGGLADVMGSLPAALARLGDEVAVLLPRYRSISAPADRIYENMFVRVGPRGYSVGIDQIVRQGVRYLFVDCPPLYDRAGIYNEAGVDYPDNHIRFAALCQTAIEVARRIFRPDVFHAHDWQAGLLPVLLRENFAADPTFFGSRCMLTIHNLGYQGNFAASALADLDLTPSLFHMEGLEFFGLLSFLKAGIVWADAVTTVSPTYAREIQTPEFGFGLDGLLRSRAGKLSGILNGVDYQEWNPETDRYLTANYSARDLSGKRAAKLALLAEMGLAPDADRPLLGIVSRFAHQKGMDLVVEACSELQSEDFALATLGSGDAPLETAFQAMAAAQPDRFAIRLGYNDGLAHRIEAGSDIFLMPSRYEPCGLNQIYSLRYGTVPVVHATGGLDDTVEKETGFKFTGLSAANLAGAIREALAAYADRKAWTARMRLGMAKDFSWDASAAQYQRLFDTRL
ncbi:MAG TPA: glycogen synthase GlgA [Bryobacteraceae bacterium]|nr:glycogen synthase GlgA [Bryobacteraceae bacterium]